jgi:hypothetical protein
MAATCEPVHAIADTSITARAAHRGAALPEKRGFCAEKGDFCKK